MGRRLAAILAADMVGYSRHVEADEEGTLARHAAHRAEFFDPAVARHHGRVVKSTGDGILAEFSSAVQAVQCAVEIQRAVTAQEAARNSDDRIAYRIGLNLGDVIDDGGDIFGDTVIIAARLEQLADPGGVLISGSVRDQVQGKIDVGIEDLGERTVKNISKAIRLFRVGTVARAEKAIPADQDIRFCRSSDGVQLAYATVGNGPPLVKAPNWLNHLEYDWESPVWRHLLRAFATDRTLVRFDARGNGLSDWDAPDISLDGFVRDLEAVVDAAGLDRFPLLGISQGCAVSIAYAARNPERVTRLVLLGGFSVGWRRFQVPDDEIQRRESLINLARSGWGQDNPAFRQIFTSLFIPDSSTEQMAWFNELERRTTSPENAARLLEALGEISVHRLLKRINVPTLVLHARNDALIPFEAGRFIARSISDARFVPLESQNHLLLEHEPAWPRFLASVTDFLNEGSAAV